MPQIFDIENAKDLFDVVEKRFKDYCGDPEKRTEDIIFIIMIVNHLREWIAPEFGPTSKDKCPDAKTDAEKFSRKLYDDTKFTVIRELCNGTKHAKKSPATTMEYETNILKWSNLLAVKNIFKGVPYSHLVDGQPIETFIAPIVELYRAWFAGQIN